MVVAMATGACRRDSAAAIKCVVVVLPLVPVTPTVVSFCAQAGGGGKAAIGSPGTLRSYSQRESSDQLAAAWPAIFGRSLPMAERSSLPRLAALAIGLGLVGMPSLAQAQIVNLLYEARDAKEGFSGRVAGGATWLSGNATSLQLQGGTLLRLRHDRHLVLAMADGAFGVANDTTFIDRQLGHLRYRADVVGPFQLEAFVQASRNPFRRRVVRTVFGAGPRMEIFDGPVLWAAVGVAYMPEYERLSEGDFPDSGAIDWHHRVSTYLSHTVVIDERLKLSNTWYVQPAVDAIDNLRAFSDLSLELKVWPSVALTLTYALQLDTLPPASVRPVDVDRRLTASWTF
jgi:hypothetical protein